MSVDGGSVPVHLVVAVEDHTSVLGAPLAVDLVLGGDGALGLDDLLSLTTRSARTIRRRTEQTPNYGCT